MRLAIIGTAGVPAKYGGFETLAEQLVLQWQDQFDLTVYNSTHYYRPEERRPTWEGAKIVYVPIKPNGLQSILYDIWSMIHALLHSDVLLVLGVSGCIFLPFLKLFSNKQIIVNVDGLEWRRAKWKGLARKFLIYSEQMAIRYADQIVADNKAIQKYIHERYNQSSWMIEYGGDHCEQETLSAKLLKKYPFLNKDYTCSVCRIEPENNIHLILEAFRISRMPLVIIGNWDHSEYGRNLLNQYSKYRNLHLLPPIYNIRILNQIRSNTSLYIHGHSAGGTNPSLVEAMYLGLPVVAFDVIYNRITTEGKALYFSDAADLVQQLLILDDASLREVRQKMQFIAEKRYRWQVIAQAYAQIITSNQPAAVPVFDFELPPALLQAFKVA